MNQKGHSLSAWIAGLGAALAIIVMLVWTGYKEGEKNVGDYKTDISGPIVLGVLLPLSGDRASYGLALQQAEEMALSEINKQGGVRGFDMEVVLEDTGCDASRVDEAASRMIEERSVTVVFGGVCDDETRAIARFALEKGILFMSPASGAGDVTSKGDFVFRTRAPEELISSVAAQYASEELGLGRVYVIRAGQSEDASQTDFENYFESFGGETAGTLEIDDEKISYVDEIVPIQESGADLLYIKGSDVGIARDFLKNVRELGIDVSVLSEANLLANDNEDFEGVFTVQVFVDHESESVQSFLSSYEKQYGKESIPPELLINMYSQMYLIRDAFIAVGLDSSRIVEFLQGLSQWKGGAFRSLTFDEQGDPLKTIAVYHMKEGELREVKRY